jgi:hypothetical protein
MNQVNALLKLASNFEAQCLNNLIKLARIKKLPNGKYRVLSMKGKNLGTYTSQAQAKRRLSMVEMFKHMDENKIDDTAIDLTDIDEFAYSAIMRKLREKVSPEQVRDFLKIFKLQFDKAVKAKIHKPEKIALQNTMIKFNKLHKVKLDPKMVKTAAVAELGNAEQVGKYLSDIVRFTLQRIPPEKRQHAIERLKQKFSVLSEGEIASKQLPESSALGQSITFVKHVLFNHDSKYVRDVLNSLVRSL